eukprot:Awhi_evm1s7693
MDKWCTQYTEVQRKILQFFSSLRPLFDAIEGLPLSVSTSKASSSSATSFHGEFQNVFFWFLNSTSSIIQFDFEENANNTNNVKSTNQNDADKANVAGSNVAPINSSKATTTTTNGEEEKSLLRFTQNILDMTDKQSINDYYESIVDACDYLSKDAQGFSVSCNVTSSLNSLAENNDENGIVFVIYLVGWLVGWLVDKLI